MSNQISPIFMKSISMVTAVPDVDLGIERVESGEVYRYIYNGGTSASVGLGLTVPASGFAGLYTCSVSSASGDLCLGFVKHAAIPSGEYGWVLKQGRVTVAVASSASTIAAGFVGLGANGVIATHTAGCAVGQLTTQIVSGNSGSLRVHLA